jgi:hypothetical protein
MKKIYVLTLIFCLPFFKMLAQPAGWSYVEAYSITNNTTSLVTNYQALLTINTQALISAGRMDANGNDILFGKDCSGSVLYNYWIESGINTSSTSIWVKIDTLFPSATRQFYFFYGNSSASAVSAIPGVFNGPMSSTDSVASGAPGGVTNSQRGFRFSPNEDILVTAFGKDEPTGTTRYVTLFNFSTQAIITQQQVAGPAGQYSYQNISSPLWLTTGTQYLLELYQDVSDGYYFGNSSQIGQQLTYYDMRYCNGCTQNTFPTNSLTNYQYGYPDLWYWTKNNVSPAPTISAGSGPLTLDAGTDPAFCFGGSALIGGTATGGTNNYTYSWSPASGLSATNTAVVTASPTVTTTYTLTATDQCGATITDQVIVTVNPLPLIAAIAVNDSICLGGNSNLMVTGSSTSYLWMPGSATTSTYNVSPGATTSYTVTGMDGNGCMNSDSVTLTVVPFPTISVSGSYAVSCSNAVSPLTMTASGAINYTWNPGSGTGTTFTDTPSASTTYTIIGTDALGCADTTTYNVTINPSPTALAVPVTDSICSGSCDTIVSTVFGGTSPYSYTWTPSNATSSFFVDCPAVTTCYTLTATDANGCVTTASTCIYVAPVPDVAATGPPAICIGDTVLLTATGSNIATINWSPGSSLFPNVGNNVGAFPSATTTYTIVATSPFGCVDSTMLTLTVNPLPIVTFTSPVTAFCINDGAYTLSGGSPVGGTYFGPGVSSGAFLPSNPGIGSHVLSYMYTDANGCTAIAHYTVFVNPCTGIQEAVTDGDISVFPNPFSTSITITRVSAGDVTVNMFDAAGRLVLTQKSNGTTIEVETNGIADGVYSLQLVDSTGTKIFKVVKNN